MVEIVQAILTGLFTGIGVSIANFINEKHMRERLDKINDYLQKTKDFVMKGKSWEEQKNG